MKRNALISVIVLAVLSVAAIFLVQFAFLKNTMEITEKEFRETTIVALREVAWQILEAKGQTSKFDAIDPVKAVSSGYYLVNVNDVIDPDVLRSQLAEQFKLHNMHLDYEYAIYDPVSHKMGHGEYVCAHGDSCREVRLADFPTSLEFTYYFGINFPRLNPYLTIRMRDWYLMTGLLITVMLFFGYSLYIIIRQRQLSEIQKVFINNLTHELKTPISSISLSAQVMSDPKIIETPGRLFEYVRIINEQSKRLSRNVEKVLNLAALEKNKLHLTREKVDVESFVNKCVERFKQSELGQKANIHCSFEKTGLAVEADIFHFTNVMQNILENAVKYCKKESYIEIGVNSRGRRLVLSIKDNGIGIPKEYRKRIFRKFYRVPTGNIHDVKGFGLGLDYVRRIVNAHRWKIEVKENVPEGTTFVLLIPLSNE